MTTDHQYNNARIPETKGIRQMSPGEFYDKYIKPYWILIFLLEFIVMPALFLAGFYLSVNRLSWVLTTIIVYMALEITSVCFRGRSIGGIRIR